MHIVGLLASPRPRGNTAALLDEVLTGAACGGATVETIFTNDLDIRPCQNCGACGKTGRCKYHDDMDRLYAAFEHLDGLVLASPIFFGSVSAQAKVVIDRCQAYWSAKYIAKRQPFGAKGLNGTRRGLFVATAGLPGKPELFAPARATVKLFFKALNVSYAGEVLAGDTDRRSVREDQILLAGAREAGRQLAVELGVTLTGRAVLADPDRLGDHPDQE